MRSGALSGAIPGPGGGRGRRGPGGGAPARGTSRTSRPWWAPGAAGGVSASDGPAPRAVVNFPRLGGGAARGGADLPTLVRRTRSACGARARRGRSRRWCACGCRRRTSEAASWRWRRRRRRARLRKWMYRRVRKIGLSYTCKFYSFHSSAAGDGDGTGLTRAVRGFLPPAVSTRQASRKQRAAMAGAAPPRSTRDPTAARRRSVREAWREDGADDGEPGKPERDDDGDAPRITGRRFLGSSLVVPRTSC